MGKLLFLAIFVGFVWWLLTKLKKKGTALPKNNTSTPTHVSFQSTKNSPYSKKTVDSIEYWLLNPWHAIPITIFNTDEKTIIKLKDALSNEHKSVRDITQSIMPIVCRSNLRCKEIDDYVAKYKPIYLENIDQQKRSSKEWLEAGEKDKEDLLSSFRTKAIETLYLKPYCDLELIFEGEPSDVTIDDSVLDKYGYENMVVYLRFFDNLDKVRIIKNDNYLREPFERLVALGLAKRGAEISLEDILETFSLNDLNSFTKDTLAEPFKRKNKAIEHILSMPNIKEQLNNRIAYREFFQLKALPGDFSHIDLRKVSNAWKYSSEVSFLIAHTYCLSNMSRVNTQYKDYDINGHWQISCTPDDFTCSFCKDRVKNTYPNKKPPFVPLHMGCRCVLLHQFAD